MPVVALLLLPPHVSDMFRNIPGSSGGRVGGNMARATGRTPTLAMDSMGALVTTGSQDLGLISHLKDDAL